MKQILFKHPEGETFLPFDEERYLFMRDDGTVEELTADKFKFNPTNTTLKIEGLSNATGGAQLFATLTKAQPLSKTKIRKKVNVLNVNLSSSNSSGIGTTTFDDGLTYGSYPYGTRVQDRDICLLKPDVTNLWGVLNLMTLKMRIYQTSHLLLSVVLMQKQVTY